MYLLYVCLYVAGMYEKYVRNVCMYLCMYAFMCVYVCNYVHICLPTYVYIHLQSSSETKHQLKYCFPYLEIAVAVPEQRMWNVWWKR